MSKTDLFEKQVDITEVGAVFNISFIVTMDIEKAFELLNRFSSCCA